MNVKPSTKPMTRRQDDEDQRLGPAADEDRQPGPALRDGRAGVAADERVRRAGRQPVVPGDQVPDDRADQARPGSRTR